MDYDGIDIPKHPRHTANSRTGRINVAPQSIMIINGFLHDANSWMDE
jgi:hypothetical protein